MTFHVHIVIHTSETEQNQGSCKRWVMALFSLCLLSSSVLCVSLNLLDSTTPRQHIRRGFPLSGVWSVSKSLSLTLSQSTVRTPPRSHVRSWLASLCCVFVWGEHCCGHPWVARIAVTLYVTCRCPIGQLSLKYVFLNHILPLMKYEKEMKLDLIASYPLYWDSAIKCPLIYSAV